ncbi:MAG: prolipoprotein diacylglyceryl transferase [Oscillospiraceae bacterium]|nr:prolipoprotein diacylglyceryl transferase [Oscillospiraceae bacterium]
MDVFFRFMQSPLRLPEDGVAFSVGGFRIYWYALIISAGMLLCVFLALRSCERHGITKETVMDLAMYCFPSAIIGARAYFVIFNLDDFRSDWLSVFNVRLGGLAIYGGIIGAALAAVIYAKVKKLEMLRLFDFAAPYLPLGQAIGRWGNFLNQEAFGSNTELPWGMKSDRTAAYLQRVMGMGEYRDKLGVDSIDPNGYVHPTFLYESLLCLAAFFLLLWLRGRMGKSGNAFYLYMVIYGAGRFVIEGFRMDSLFMGSIRVSQGLALIFVIVFGIALLLNRSQGRKKSAPEATGESEYGGLLRRIRAEEGLAPDGGEAAGGAAGEAGDDGGSEPGADEGPESEADGVSEPGPDGDAADGACDDGGSKSGAGGGAAGEPDLSDYMEDEGSEPSDYMDGGETAGEAGEDGDSEPGADGLGR